MSEPVKLSRERWEMLRRSGPNLGPPAECKRITLAQPLEIAGIIFLPAEYVPPSDPVRPETWWQRAYSA